jgi:hypothetical protein
VFVTVICSMPVCVTDRYCAALHCQHTTTLLLKQGEKARLIIEFAVENHAKLKLQEGRKAKQEVYIYMYLYKSSATTMW